MRELSSIRNDLLVQGHVGNPLVAELLQVIDELSTARGAMKTMQEERDRQRYYYLQLQAQVKNLSLEVERRKRGDFTDEEFRDLCRNLQERCAEKARQAAGKNTEERIAEVAR